MKQGPELTFTIFTAAYNRAQVMSRAYDSLCAQTFRDFEWLIVDDGSTDETRETVETWQRQASFPIRYIYQENQRKHIAHNRAIQEARGRFFLTLDDDDACLPKALELLYYHWNIIPFEQQAHFSAVTGLCMDQQGNLVGDRFPQDVLDSDSLEVHYRYKVRGEKWGFQRTDVLRRFPFPILPGFHGYMPESVVWSRIAREYRTRYINEILRVFYVGHDSVSHTARLQLDQMRQNAAGQVLHNQGILNDQVDYMTQDPLTFLRAAVHYARFSKHAGISYRAQWQNLHNARGRALWSVAAPVGALAHWRDLRRGSGA